MDEFREKSGTGNLPAQNMSCWNDSMQPSKVELAALTSASSTTGRGTENRRSEAQLDREIGRALTDALTDILSAEKQPSQRRNIS